MENIIRQGENTIKAHLRHLKDHGEVELLTAAVSNLKEKEFTAPDFEPEMTGCTSGSGGPGSQNIAFVDKIQTSDKLVDVPSVLRHRPIQMHPVSPIARQAMMESGRKIPVKVMVVGIQEEILEDKWLEN